MKGSWIKLSYIVALLAVVIVGWTLVASGETPAPQVTHAESDVPLEASELFEETAKPDVPSCCNPDTEPGIGGNPYCFEGHTCCASGQWGCNNPDGSPSCAPGEVCTAGCGGKNEACDADDDCCSTTCKPNGRCR